jgi:hypothetical protein
MGQCNSVTLVNRLGDVQPGMQYLYGERTSFFATLYTIITSNGYEGLLSHGYNSLGMKLVIHSQQKPMSRMHTAVSIFTFHTSSQHDT